MSVTSASIELDLRREFTFSKGGGVSCGIVLRIGEEVFPRERWGDFAVQILAVLCEALERSHRASFVSEVSFMEGPFVLRVARSDRDDELKLELVERLPRHSRVVGKHVVSTARFVGSVIDEGTRLLGAVRAAGWWTADATRLDEAIKRLGAEVA